MPIYNNINKPITPKYLDTSNSLTTGLVFDAQLYEATGTTALDLAGNVSGSFTGSPTWGTRNPFGKIITFTDSTNIINYTSISSQNSLASITIESLVFPTAENAANDARIIMKGNGSPAKYFSLAYANTNKFELSIQWQTVEGDWDTPVFAANNWYHIVATYSYSNVSNQPIIYINGVSQSLSILSTASGSAPVDDTTISIGNRNSAGGSTKGFVGDIAYTRVWNRILSQSEVSLLYSNPWRIYARPNNPNTLKPRPFAPGIAR